MCFQIRRLSSQGDGEGGSEAGLTGTEARRWHVFMVSYFRPEALLDPEVEGVHTSWNTVGLGEHCPVFGIRSGSRTEVCFSLCHIGFLHWRV